MELQKKIDAVQEMRLLEDVFFEAVGYSGSTGDIKNNPGR